MDKHRGSTILVVAFVVAFLVGCAARKPHTTIYLPQFALHSSVNTADGVDKREARFIAEAYLGRYVTLCGMPDDPVLENDCWVTKLWVGIIPASYAGKFRISQATGDVVYEPRRNRFGHFEMERLRQGIALTQRERSGTN